MPVKSRESFWILGRKVTVQFYTSPRQEPTASRSWPHSNWYSTTRERQLFQDTSEEKVTVLNSGSGSYTVPYCTVLCCFPSRLVWCEKDGRSFPSHETIHPRLQCNIILEQWLTQWNVKTNRQSVDRTVTWKQKVWHKGGRLFMLGDDV